MTIKTVPVISQNIHTAILDDINNEQIIFDLNNYGISTTKDQKTIGWTKNGFVHFDDIIVPITPEITKLENRVLETIKELTGKEYKVEDILAVNLLKNQSVISHSHYSNLHTHPEEYFSIVYYPEASLGSAELMFATEWCGVMQRTLTIVPSVGLLVIFNSYMTHMTTRHRIDEPRISVSMNLAPIEPNKTPNADWSIYWDRPVIENPRMV